MLADATNPSQHLAHLVSADTRQHMPQAMSTRDKAQIADKSDSMQDLRAVSEEML